jgi:hypothetical protein
LASTGQSYPPLGRLRVVVTTRCPQRATACSRAVWLTQCDHVGGGDTSPAYSCARAVDRRRRAAKKRRWSPDCILWQRMAGLRRRADSRQTLAKHLLNMELHISARWARGYRNARNILDASLAENKAPMLRTPTEAVVMAPLPSPQFTPDRMWESSSDLCVVDVVQAICAEASFPHPPDHGPREDAQGMHFFFRRSLRASLHGYDGAAQRMTVWTSRPCAAAGRRVCGGRASADKEWVIAPWGSRTCQRSTRPLDVVRARGTYPSRHQSG